MTLVIVVKSLMISFSSSPMDPVGSVDEAVYSVDKAPKVIKPEVSK